MIDKAQIILQEIRDAGLPDLTIADKRATWWWRILPRQWRSRSVTTLGRTIWLPGFWLTRITRTPRLAAMLAHEARHATDWGARFLLGYLAPQLPLLVLLALAWAICGGLFDLPLPLHVGFGAGLLASLAPWPSPSRLYWERRGHLAAMAVEHALTGTVARDTLGNVERALYSRLYWRMVWGRDRARRIVRAMHDEVVSGHALRSDPLIRAAVRGASRNDA
jgi:hypothetical protein